MAEMKIHFSKKAHKEYLKLPLVYKELLDKTLEKFQKGIPVDITSIKGEKDKYRIRIGKYRVLFLKLTPDILIVSIDTRGDVYK